MKMLIPFSKISYMAIFVWTCCSITGVGGITVLEFQENRVATVHSLAIYQGNLDRDWRMDSVTLCARFQLFILHGWATFFHLFDEYGQRMQLAGELWLERVRPVLSRNWNFQIMKQQLWMFRWYHLCFTYSHEDHLIKTYINGEKSNTQEYNIGRTINGNKAVLGQGSTPERSLSGRLTQVNVWDRALDQEEIMNISSCQSDPQGNYISWDAGWTLQSVTSFNMPLEELCKTEVARTHFLFPDMPFGTAQYLCLALGTTLPRVEPLSNIIDIVRYTMRAYPQENTCYGDYWTSLTDLQEEGVWRYHDGEIPLTIPWDGQEPNGLTYENCAVIFSDGMADIDCKTNRKCVACTFSVQQRFSLLGTCENELRNVYFIANQNEAGTVFFMGYGEFYIRQESDHWLWVNDVLNHTVARMEDIDPNFPMGRRWWKLERAVCDQKPGERRQLLLSPCNSDQFTCDDATCITHNKRCDLKYDCGDNSDEAYCKMVARPVDYQQHLPPRSSQGEVESLPIVVSINVESISVKTMEMTVEVSHEIILTWEDNRLQYLDLKVDNTLNVLPYETMKSLWTPKVSFVNTNDNHHTSLDSDTTMMIDRRADDKWRDEAAPAEVDVFPGNINTISIKRKYGITYNCDFHLALYPFDVQQCYMHLRITSAPKSFLVFDVQNSSAQNKGESHLAEYNVGQLEIIHDQDGIYSEIKVVVPLSRLYGYAILNIFIPTLVLLVISYVTLFLRTEVFDVRMMGALTVQLVIATLFSQVSASLPKTSYFKMVDIWLIFCIGITFLVIICHAITDNILFQKSQVPDIQDFSTSSKAWNEPLKTEPWVQNMTCQKVVLATKIIVLLVFILFNVGYWGYIAS